MSKLNFSYDRLDAVGRELTHILYRLLALHLRGDVIGVAAILQAHLEANPRLREKLEDEFESKQIRQAERWQAASHTMHPGASSATSDVGRDDASLQATVVELREALDIANRAGIRATSQVVALEKILADLSAQVSKIVVAHIKGDHDAVSQAVSAFCEKHVVKSSDTARKVH